MSAAEKSFDIETKILLIRGQKVILSTHLAQLYGVQAKVLVQAVKRNSRRFPEDFMFQLNPEEFANLRSQIVTSSWGGARRSRPYAFTEHGIAMLSSVLNSRRAVQINIAIIRTFVKLRQMIAANKEIADRLIELERRMDRRDKEIISLFEALRELMMPPVPSSKPEIGFHPSK